MTSRIVEGGLRHQNGRRVLGKVQGEERRGGKRWGSGSRVARSVVLGVGLALLATAPASGLSLALSTQSTETIDGTVFLDGDVISMTGAATALALEGDIFTDSEDIDALSWLPNGHLVFSTEGSASVKLPGGGTLGIKDSDLVEYDLATGEASLFLAEDVLFDTNVDVDALHVLTNGHVLFSFNSGSTGQVTLWGDTFLDGDMVQWDGADLSLFLSESVFGADRNIDGFSILDGSYLISVDDNGGATIGGLAFSDGEIVSYDPVSQTAALFLSVESRSSTNPDVDALAVITPEPSTLLLVAPGLIAMVTISRRRRLPC